MVKVNFPRPERRIGVERSYDAKFSGRQAVEAVVRSAIRSLVLISDGERSGDEAMLAKASESMTAGAAGLIFGRNVWQREHDESMRFVERLREIMAKFPGS